uniref:Uncharacterized protein n=1 Tax=viral metagenome TaxID=1070528 RepID=A0A6C0D0R9_9ZZZZ
MKYSKDYSKIDGITREMKPCRVHNKSHREEYIKRYDNVNWSDQNINFDYVKRKDTPCQKFYQTFDTAQIDGDCWDKIRGAALQTVNAVSSASQTSCMPLTCADPSSYGSDTVPPTDILCPWLNCVATNATSCGNTLVQAVFSGAARGVTCNTIPNIPEQTSLTTLPPPSV